MNKFGKVALLKEAWALFKKNLNVVVMLIGVYFAYYIAQYVSTYLFGNTQIAFIMSLVFIVISLILQLGSYNLMLKLVDGKNPQIKDLYQLAKEIWPTNFHPTSTHIFIKLLHDKNML